MKRMFGAGLALAAAALAGVGEAARAEPAPPPTGTTHDYVYIGTIKGSWGLQVGYTDLVGVQRQGATVTVWTLWVQRVPASIQGAEVSYALRRYTYDCTAKTSLMGRVSIYSDTGALLYDDPKGDHSPVPVEADTPAQAGMAMVCAGAPPEGARYPDVESAIKAARATDAPGG
jgi:hypothetical protein